MAKKAPNNGWWRGGVIYQIYPRSYQDTNADGIGDLPGITQRLVHIAALGADGIWLSPFFKSPMKDFGYDVSDYRDVDPMFGTLDDFRALVARAHALGLKVMIDQVLSHTADQHPWFVQSRSSRTNPKADWYVWADAQDDGNPPNNWLSIFGGSAWQWDTGRLQYYMHNFLTSQPDLNFHHPDVQQAVLDDVRFWLELGVDGYRLDTANFYFHDRQLRSNPGRGQPDGEDPAVNATNPYGWQRHLYDKSQPENLVFLQRLRALLDEYPNTAMVGEIGDDDGLGRMAEYTGLGPDGQPMLHMAYCFDLLGTKKDAPFLQALFSRFLAVVGDGWPCWALSNHDCMRLASRWGGPNPDPRLLRLAAALQMTLRGTPCIYQGDELGLPEADVAYEDLQDPFGITMWPSFKGRDGCRTPMPWASAEPHAGFGPAKPWLPVSEAHGPLAVDTQQGQPGSLLSFYTQLLHWRRGQPALVHGDMALLPGTDQVLAYERSHESDHHSDSHRMHQRMGCVFNFSADVAIWDLPAGWAQASAHHLGLAGAHIDIEGNRLVLQPWGGLVATL